MRRLKKVIILAVIAALTVTMCAVSASAASTNKVKLIEEQDWFWIRDASFTIKEFCVTEGQNSEGKIQVGKTVCLEEGEYFAFEVNRQGSVEVAEWFNDRFGGKRNTFNKDAGKLNFAIAGDLTVTLVKENDGGSGNRTVLPVTFEDVCFAQGHTGTSNNWWFAQKKGERSETRGGNNICAVGTSVDIANNTVKTVEAIFERGYFWGPVNEVHILYFEVTDPQSDTGSTFSDLTVVFHTADEEDAGTDADVWMEIEYEDGTTWGVDNRREIPYLDHDGPDFYKGATDEYTFRIPDKTVKSYRIVKEGGDNWLLDSVEIDGVLYDGPGRWLEEGDDSFTIECYHTPDVILTLETGNWNVGGSDGDVYATFYVKDPETGAVNPTEEYHLDNPGDDFRPGEEDVYTLADVPEGTIEYFDIRFSTRRFKKDTWDLESVSVNGCEPITVHHTFAWDETYRVFMDTEMIEKSIEIHTGDNGTEADVRVKFSFSDGTETSFINLYNPGGAFEADTNSLFELRIPDKEIVNITIQLLSAYDILPGIPDSWNLEYFIFDGVKYDNNESFGMDSEHSYAYKSSNTASTFSDINTGLIIGIGVPVIVIAAAAVIVVLRKKKKNSADTAE